jgi:hypothetical protein
MEPINSSVWPPPFTEGSTGTLTTDPPDGVAATGALAPAPDPEPRPFPSISADARPAIANPAVVPSVLGADAGDGGGPAVFGAEAGASVVLPPAPAATAAPTGYDVSDDAVFKKLSSGTSAEKVLAAEIQRARQSYRALFKDAKLYLTVCPSNGGKPVLVVVPNALATDANPSFNTVVHYHGMQSTATHPNPAAQADIRIDQQIQGSPPTVFVLPEANNGDGDWTAAFFPDWTNVKDTRGTADEALKAAGLAPTASSNGHLTVSAHSAGGRALAVAAHRGALSCDRLLMEDCLYGVKSGRFDSFAGTCAVEVKKWAQTPQGKGCTEIAYVRSQGGGNSEDANAADFPEQTFTKEQVVNHYDAAFHTWPAG